MTREVPFDFTDQEIAAGQGIIVAHLPTNLTNQDELLRALYELLRFPGYFGFNWNALTDCLADFHWIAERTVVLVHADLPPLPLSDRRLYLDVLADAVESWRPGEDHSFRVVFPTAAQPDVTATLALTSR